MVNRGVGLERVSLTPAQQLQESLLKQQGLPLDHLRDATSAAGKQVYRKHISEETAPKDAQKRIQYQLKSVIGKGSFGVVYKAVNRRTDQVVAIKEVDYENDEELNDIMSEIHLLKNLNHENIVKYHGFIQKLDTLYIILEYCSKGSLKKLISPSHGIPEQSARLYIRQTLQGLSYLHEQGVIHRDIKAANLLLDSNNVVKLADFGVSTRVNNATMAMTLAGSLNWMAPEIIGNRGASTLSDIWSLGATVIELLTGNPPFHNLVDINIYYAIENDTYLPPANIFSPLAQDFLALCLQKNMYWRPTAQQLLQHGWLQASGKPEAGFGYRESISSSKLQKFKEDFGYNWDHDFKEKNIDLSPIRSVGSQALSSVSDSSDPVSSGNNQASVRKVDFMQELVKGHMIDDMQLMFAQTPLEEIIEALFQVLSASAEQVTADAKNKVVNAIFSHDGVYNSSKLKLKFVDMGGIPLLFDNENILWNSFCNITDKIPVPGIYKMLIQCGITREFRIKKLNNSVLVLRIAYEYLNLTSLNFWWKWCSSNLGLRILLQPDVIHEKIAHTIILKLSSHIPCFAKEFLPLLVECVQPMMILHDQQTFYTIFKSIAYMLTLSPSNASTDYNDNPYTLALGQESRMSSSSSSAATGYSGTVDMSMLTLNTSTSTNSIFLSRLPERFESWLISFLEVDDVQIDNFYWKYYIRVCFIYAHLSKGSLVGLCSSSNFISVVIGIVDGYGGKQGNKKLLPVMQYALSLCTEISLEVSARDINGSFINMAIKLAKISEFTVGGIEVILNCLQTLVHNHVKFEKEKETSHVSCAPRPDTKFSINYSDLVEPFFVLEENDPSFGNFINKYTKLCAIPAFESVCHNIVVHEGFVRRIISFFTLYAKSLLIQIDLLKLIRLLYTKSAGIDDPKMRCTLDELVCFLDRNWDKKNANSTVQVGSDSILIQQLCRDIKVLHQGHLST